MTIREREQDFDARFVARVESACMGGGDSSSSSSSSNATNTTNVDKRQVVSDNGLGVSSDSSTVNVSILDQNAIEKAVNLAGNTQAGALDAYKALLSATVLLNGNATKAVADQSQLSANLSGDVQATADTQKKMLVYAALGVGALVLFGKVKF